MATFTQILYQLVFSTKSRHRVMTPEGRPELFRYISGILRKKECRVYIINGVEDHLHIVTHLHPSVALASLVKDIKIASSVFIKKHELFQDFEGWQVGYGAFTYSITARKNLIAYVKNQEEHHKAWSYREELMALLKEHEVEWDERYLE